MGIPFSLVIWVAGKMFKDLGHSDTDIALATGSVGIVWSLKPFWASFLDMYRTKKFWVLGMEFLIAILLGLVAAVLPPPHYFQDHHWDSVGLGVLVIDARHLRGRRVHHHAGEGRTGQVDWLARRRGNTGASSPPRWSC